MNQAPELTIDDFRPRLGQAFQVDTTNGPLEMILSQVQELPKSGRAGGAFRLEFHGPAQPLLVQAIYVFNVGRSRCPIFIVPLGPIGPRRRYEAVFY